MRKNDIFASASIGFFVALSLLLIKSSGNIPELNTIPFIESALFLFPILSIIGMKVARKLSKKFPLLLQAAKFLLVGASNTFLDLGVLNVLISQTGISSGIRYSLFKGISFLVALTNSYLWNKYWTFAQKDTQTIAQKGKEAAKFFLISAIGFALNVGTASFVVNVIGPQFGIAKNTWATAGALMGTFVVLTWNFLGYKFLVFKS